MLRPFPQPLGHPDRELRIGQHVLDRPAHSRLEGFVWDQTPAAALVVD